MVSSLSHVLPASYLSAQPCKDVTKTWIMGHDSGCIVELRIYKNVDPFSFECKGWSSQPAAVLGDSFARMGLLFIMACLFCRGLSIYRLTKVPTEAQQRVACRDYVVLHIVDGGRIISFVHYLMVAVTGFMMICSCSFPSWCNQPALDVAAPLQPF